MCLEDHLGACDHLPIIAGYFVLELVLDFFECFSVEGTAQRAIKIFKEKVRCGLVMSGHLSQVIHWRLIS